MNPAQIGRISSSGHAFCVVVAAMDLIMTLPDDDEGYAARDAYVSSDDDDFAFGAGVAADIADPSVSGKWGTSRARGTATAHSKASRAAALDARLAERAAANTGPDAPPLQASGPEDPW